MHQDGDRGFTKTESGRVNEMTLLRGILPSPALHHESHRTREISPEQKVQNGAKTTAESFQSSLAFLKFL
jgi:hypothetical protein